MTSERRFASEQDLARVIVAWLKIQHWEVYQEVATGYAEARADIVAVQASVSWIIETKRTLSLGVIAQAVDWLGSANFVSVAVPRVDRLNRGRAFAQKLLHDKGIGLIEADPDHYEIYSREPRKWRRLRRRPITDYLWDEQKTMVEAGSCRGGYATPFSRTCRAVAAFVALHPGCTMRELVDGVDHHYSNDASARSCLRHWLGEDKIPGIERRADGRTWHLFPVTLVRGSR
jgi:hypothetical protein